MAFVTPIPHSEEVFKNNILLKLLNSEIFKDII